MGGGGEGARGKLQNTHDYYNFTNTAKDVFVCHNLFDATRTFKLYKPPKIRAQVVLKFLADAMVRTETIEIYTP